jgi:hypothetical protein
MKKVKEKVTKLKNIYTGEVVFTSNLFEKRVDSNLTFIQVYTEANPGRKYFVNGAAFVPLTK